MMQFVRNLILVGVFASFCAGIASAGPTSNHLLKGMKAADGLLVQIQGRCETLRRACENRDVLGERGAGNCRRYREQCGRYRPGCAEPGSAFWSWTVCDQCCHGSCRDHHGSDTPVAVHLQLAGCGTDLGRPRQLSVTATDERRSESLPGREYSARRRCKGFLDPPCPRRRRQFPPRAGRAFSPHARETARCWLSAFRKRGDRPAETF